MEIHASARRHEVADADILHAVEHSLVVDDVGEDAEPRRHTKSGKPLTDEAIAQLADEAERGYDVEEILGRRGKRGRPSLGSAPSTVESVRLDPELKEQLARRAEADGLPVSEVIREALRRHLGEAS